MGGGLSVAFSPFFSGGTVTTTLEFFHKLYGRAPQGHFYVWLKWPGKDRRSKTIWVETLEEAADAVAEYSGKVNVYFGICTSNRIKENNQRTKRPDAHMMPAFVLDVDYQAPHHLKPGLPESRAAALAIITNAPLEPTMIVESGGGFHAYWKFKEPLIFRDDSERDGTHDISFGWQNRFRADNPGITLDSTHDLPRVLRVPGSMNLGAGSLCEVVLMEGPEYSPTDFLPFITIEPEKSRPNKSLLSAQRTGAPGAPLPDSGPQGAMTPAVAQASGPGMLFPHIPGVAMDGTATPCRPDQFGVNSTFWIGELKDRYDKFRKVMRPGVADDSVADVLALRLYINECINQEPPMNPDLQVCYDLISFLRHQPGREANTSAKAFRLDYLESTVRNVVENTKPKKKDVSGDKPAAPAPEGAPSEPAKAAPPEKKKPAASSEATPVRCDGTLESVSGYLGLPVCNLIKYVGTDPQMYSLDVVMPGSVPMRTLHVSIQELQELKMFERKWAAVACKAIRGVTNQTDWKQKVFPYLIPLFVEQDIPEEATTAGQLRQGIISYLYAHTVMADRDAALLPRQPFTTILNGDKRTCLFFDNFVEFMLAHAKGESLSGRKIAMLLSQHKISAPVQLRFTQETGAVVKERVYPLPEELVAESLNRHRSNMLAEHAGNMEIPEEELWQPDPNATQ